MTAVFSTQVMSLLLRTCGLASIAIFGVSCKSYDPDMQKSPIVENSIGMQMRYIEPGVFMMGSTAELAWSDEYPVLETTIEEPYYIGVYEVTCEEWFAVMGGAQLDDPNQKTLDHDGAGRSDSDAQSERYPIDSISWLEAQEFCRRLSEKEGRVYRLPTEAEWEYACRAGTETEYYWGDNFDPRYAWTDENSGARVHPVGLKLPNGWGLYDMAGNLKEWCQDIYRYKRGITLQRYSRGSEEFKVIKGNGWKWLGRYCRSSKRFQAHQSTKESKYGFRVVMLHE